MSYYGKTLGFFRTAGYDSDAAAFFTGAGITDSGEKDLWNDFVQGSKSDAIYSKIKTFHPLLGSSLTTKSYNAINTAVAQLNYVDNHYDHTKGVRFNEGVANYTISGASASNSGVGLFVQSWAIGGGSARQLMNETVNLTINIKTYHFSPDYYAEYSWDSNTDFAQVSYSGGLLALQATATDTSLYVGNANVKLLSDTNSNTYAPSTIEVGDSSYGGEDVIISCSFATDGLDESDMILLKNRIYTLMNGLGRGV